MSFKYLVDDAIAEERKSALCYSRRIDRRRSGGVSGGSGCDYLYAKFTTGVLNDLRWRMFAVSSGWR
jgi:hypothetical protein